jgi:hypothetical protein
MWGRALLPVQAEQSSAALFLPNTHPLKMAQAQSGLRHLFRSLYIQNIKSMGANWTFP